MSDTHLANDPASRTPTGEIKDQTQTTPETPPTPDPKPEGTTLLNKDDAKPGDPKPEDKPKVDGVPDKYDLKPPKGYTLDEAAITEVSALFKDLGLSNESGQKLLDFYAAKTLEAAEAPYKLVEKQRADWQKEANADRQVGHRLPEVKQNFSKMLDSLGNPTLSREFREAMDLTGAGDHPAFIRLMDVVSQRLNEGTHVSGSGPSKLGQVAPGTPRPSAAKSLFPNLA